MGPSKIGECAYAANQSGPQTRKSPSSGFRTALDVSANDQVRHMTPERRQRCWGLACITASALTLCDVSQAQQSVATPDGSCVKELRLAQINHDLVAEQEKRFAKLEAELKEVDPSGAAGIL